jgi:hypothetical protein
VVESTFPRKRLAVDGDANERSKLVEMFCRNGEEAVDAAGAGADFLVLRNVLADGELAALCDSVPSPLFARGIGLEQLKNSKVSFPRFWFTRGVAGRECRTHCRERTVLPLWR